MTAAPSEPQPEKATKRRIPKEAYPILTAGIGAFATILAALIGFWATRSPQPAPVIPSQPLVQAATAAPTVPILPTAAPATPTPALLAAPPHQASDCLSRQAYLKLYDTKQWDVGSYRPSGQNLKYFPVLEDLVEPKYPGAKQLYGILDFPAFGQYAVVLDYDSDTGLGRNIYLDINQNLNLTDDPPYPIMNRNSTSETNTVVLNPGQPDEYYLRFYFVDRFNKSNGTFRLIFNTRSLKAGCMRLAGKKIIAGVIDDSNNGFYNDVDQDTLVFDLNNDQVISKEETYDSLDTAVMLDDTCYAIQTIDAEGTHLELKEVPFVNLQGQVENEAGQPVSDAVIELFHHSELNITDFEGHFSIRTCPGKYWNLKVRHPLYLTRDLDPFSVSADQSQPMMIQLLAKPTGGEEKEVMLENMRGYDFLLNQAGSFGFGELYMRMIDNELFFYADISPQNGVQDLGEMAGVDFQSVVIPKDGYRLRDVKVIRGHTYVARARTGEEGHYVLFTVTDMIGDRVMLRYLYR